MYMEEEESSDYVASSVINSPPPMLYIPNFAWLQCKKSDEEILEETQSEILKPVGICDEDTQDSSSLSIVLPHNDFLSSSRIIDNVKENSQDLLTDGNVCEQDNDDETESNVSEVLVSVSDLLHYAAVEAKKPQSYASNNQEDWLYTGACGQVFSQPQVRGLGAGNPEDPMSNDRVGSLERGQLSDHNYSQPIADLYPDHGMRSCDRMSGPNSLELIDCCDSDSNKNSREGCNVPLSASGFYIPTVTDCIPSELHCSSETVAMETHRIKEPSDVGDTEACIDQKNESQIKEILGVEQLLGIVRQNLENYNGDENAIFGLLRDAQQILHQLHLQQRQETQSITKRIQDPGKCKAGLSLLLYKGRLLKTRRAKLLTTTSLYQTLYGKAFTCSMKTQLREKEVGNLTKRQLETAFENCSDSTRPDNENGFPGAAAAISDQDTICCIVACPPESTEIWPKEISTFPMGQSFCHSNGSMSLTNAHLVEVPVESSTMQATGNENVVEPQIHTALDMISRDNYPKGLENSAASATEGNCRYVAESLHLPPNNIGSVVAKAPYLLNVHHVAAAEPLGINSAARIEEVDLNAALRSISNYEAQFVSKSHPCFGKSVSFHSMDPQLQMNLTSNSHPFQTVSVPLAIHQSQSVPCVVPQQQQLCMAVTENVVPSLWPFGVLQQWHAAMKDADRANVPSTESNKCVQRENSEENSSDLCGKMSSRFINDDAIVLETEDLTQAASLERRNFLGNASFKQLFDDGLVRPGMNVLTVRSKNGQVTASITTNGHIKSHRGKTFKTFRSWYLNALEIQDASQNAINQEVMYYGVPVGSLISRTAPSGSVHHRKGTIRTKNQPIRSVVKSKQNTTDLPRESTTTSHSSKFTHFHVHSKDELEFVNWEIWSTDISIQQHWIESLDRWS